MYQVKQLTSNDTALEIVDFLLSDNAIQQTWAPGEAELVRKAVVSSVNSKDNHAYWYVEDNEKIIGAMGVRENDYKSGGYEMIYPLTLRVKCIRTCSFGLRICGLLQVSRFLGYNFYFRGLKT